MRIERAKTAPGRALCSAGQSPCGFDVGVGPEKTHRYGRMTSRSYQRLVAEQYDILAPISNYGGCP